MHHDPFVGVDESNHNSDGVTQTLDATSNNPIRPIQRWHHRDHRHTLESFGQLLSHNPGDFDIRDVLTNIRERQHGYRVSPDWSRSLRYNFW